MHIGDSIQEAIDWTQDRLATTRPLAERTLFLLLSAKQVTETEAGFMLSEDINDEELFKKHVNVLQGQMKPKFRFHKARKHGFKHLRHYLKHLDNSDAAEDMLNTEDDK